MEVYALKYLESRFTPKLYDVVMDKERIYMVQERAGKRTLKSFVNKYKAKITVKNILVFYIYYFSFYYLFFFST